MPERYHPPPARARKAFIRLTACTNLSALHPDTDSTCRGMAQISMPARARGGLVQALAQGTRCNVFAPAPVGANKAERWQTEAVPNAAQLPLASLRLQPHTKTKRGILSPGGY